MPVWNAERTVASAVESIRQQSCPDWELVIVDDGSEDDTTRILGAFSRDDPRIVLLRQDHRGFVPALNTGLNHCRADWVARMDADDFSYRERLQSQLAWAESHPDCGVISCLVDYGGDRQAQAGYAVHVDWINSLTDPESIALKRFVESPLAHPSALIRKELFDSHGAYAAGDFPEDYELWLRFLDAGIRFSKVPAWLIRWNDPPDRLSRSAPQYSDEAFARIKATYLNRWLAAHLRGTEKRLLFWGAGRATRKRTSFLQATGWEPDAWIDIDPRKLGQSIAGKPVISPDETPPPGQAFILSFVWARGAREDITQRLESRGYKEGADFLLVA